MDAGGAAERHHFLPAPDGRRLHVVEFGPAQSARLPAVCLPGLARTAEDFRELATALATGAAARRVLALDYRGRGRSEYDPDPANYALPVELADLRAVLAALAVGPAVFVGTSRGGLLTMLLAATAPEALAGAVLNDIGPVIEPAGLQRIKGYVGKLPQPRDFAEGAEILRRLFAAQFPRFDAAQWAQAARLTWHAEAGRLVLNYDPQLAQTLAAVEPDTPLPPLWEAFDALAPVPVLVIRGALSDLLAPATVAAMRARHPALELVEVADEGHPPGLGSAPMVARIAAFLEACERRRARA